MTERKNRFSIRKLTIGAAGVSSKQAKAALPQTGAKKTEAAAAGLALAAVAGILGLAGKKRKHN